MKNKRLIITASFALFVCLELESQFLYLFSALSNINVMKLICTEL